MNLTPAALAFLRDLYAARAAHLYREGHALTEAKETALDVCRELARHMREGFIAEIDGAACVQATVKQPSSNYQQERLTI